MPDHRSEVFVPSYASDVYLSPETVTTERARVVRSHSTTGFGAAGLFAAGIACTFGSAPGGADTSTEIIPEPGPNRIAVQRKNSSAANIIVIPGSNKGLEAQMQRLIRTQERQAERMQLLSRQVMELYARQSADDFEKMDLAGDPAVLEANLVSAFDAGAGGEEALAILLDLVADRDVASDAVARIAELSLQSDDAFLRASAARALANARPKLAVKVLPELIEKEANNTARTILEAAYRAALL